MGGVDGDRNSDHRYVMYSVDAFPRELIERRRTRETTSRRWTLKKLDQDAFLASIEATLMVEGEEMRWDEEDKRAWLLRTVVNACDAQNQEKIPPQSLLVI